MHRADLNGDGEVGIQELLRLIQLYNAAGYHCAANAGGTEDGFEVSTDGGAEACVPHASDYDPQDWTVELSELLRMVQMYNSGGYESCPSAEDGFCATRQSE